MANFFTKAKNYLLGTVDEYEEYEPEYETAAPQRESHRTGQETYGRYVEDYEPVYNKREKAEEPNNVLSIQPENQMQIKKITPKALNDATDISDCLSHGMICIINMEGADDSISQRIADYIAGAVYAMNGNIDRISNYIFVISPNYVPISDEMKSELKESYKSSYKRDRESYRSYSMGYARER